MTRPDPIPSARISCAERFTSARGCATEERGTAAAAAKQAERADTLYRWRDDAGNLQITEDPPTGRKYERISRTPKDGLEVHGARE